MVDARFYEYVSELLNRAGHMITSTPIYTNHSASETLYIDSNKDVTTNRFDRTMLMQLDNVSLLTKITWPEAKLRRAKELRDLAMLKRKNVEQLALAITTAEMRRDEKRLVAEKCTQVSKDLEHQARQEALQREQERIAAEQRERERLAEIARREAQFDSAKQKLKVNDGDPFVVWLSNKAKGEFLVDIYIAYNEQIAWIEIRIVKDPTFLS